MKREIRVTYATGDCSQSAFHRLVAKYNVSPPTTTRDGFVKIIANMKSGNTVMVIHHIGNSELKTALGNSMITAPVPRG